MATKQPEFAVINRRNPINLSRQTWKGKACPKCQTKDVEKIEADDEMPDWHTWICNDCYHQWYYDEKTVKFKRLDKPEEGDDEGQTCYT